MKQMPYAFTKVTHGNVKPKTVPSEFTAHVGSPGEAAKDLGLKS
jgi:hypothetical protein